MSLRREMIRLSPVGGRPQDDVVALLGPDTPGEDVEGGGWEERARRKRKSVIEWQGAGLERREIQIRFDGWINRDSVQFKVDRLTSLYRRPSGAPNPRPIQIEGAVSGTHLTWVIERITWGDELRDEQTGELLRKEATVRLAEYNPGTVLVPQRTAGKPAQRTPYRVKKGDTLTRIMNRPPPIGVGAKASKAARARWKEQLRVANQGRGIQNYKRWIQQNVGKILYLPAGSS